MFQPSMARAIKQLREFWAAGSRCRRSLRCLRRRIRFIVSVFSHVSNDALVPTIAAAACFRPQKPAKIVGTHLLEEDKCPHKVRHEGASGSAGKAAVKRLVRIFVFPPAGPARANIVRTCPDGWKQGDGLTWADLALTSTGKCLPARRSAVPARRPACRDCSIPRPDARRDESGTRHRVSSPRGPSAMLTGPGELSGHGSRALYLAWGAGRARRPGLRRGALAFTARSISSPRRNNAGPRSAPAPPLRFPACARSRRAVPAWRGSLRHRRPRPV